MPIHHCAGCGLVTGEIVLEDLGLEQPIDFRLAAALVPMTPKQLAAHLSRHKVDFPATYRVHGRGRRRHRIRVLTPREIKLVRTRALRGPGVDQYLR